MKVLITNRDTILSRQVVTCPGAGAGYGSAIHCLHVYIAQLRRKIGADPSRPRLIVSVPGVGYRFTSVQEWSA